MVRRRAGGRGPLAAGVGATAAGDNPQAGRQGSAAPAEPPRRRCICTGETGPRAQLLRFVVGPDGEIIPDVAATLPGRGLWLTPRRDIVERAVAKRLFARAARRAVTVSPGLAKHIESLLARRCRDGIGLARRAGLAVGGFEKVCLALRAGDAAVLFAAVDAAEGGRRKIRGLARGLPIVVALTAAELGAAFGRNRLVHAAVGSGPLGDRLLADAGKLAGFRAGAMIERVVGRAPAAQVALWRDDRYD